MPTLRPGVPMNPLAIIGAGSHGRSIAELARARGWLVEFHDDDPDLGAPIDPDKVWAYTLGVNNPHTRVKLADRLAGCCPVTLTHSRAIIGEGCSLGEGAVVHAGVILTCDVELGHHTQVNVGATISQGSRLGNFCGVAPGAHIAGQVTVGDRSYIGVGASVSNLVTIGFDCIIGAGAAVISDVPDGMTYAGVPAKALHLETVAWDSRKKCLPA